MQVKKSLVGYLPGTSGAHSPKAPMLCTAKQPRAIKRKPRSDSRRLLQEQRSSQQQRRSGKRAQELRCVPLSGPPRLLFTSVGALRSYGFEPL